MAQHLTNGGKPPATDDDGGLRIFLDSTLDKDSISDILLPVPLPWEKFCQKIIFINKIVNDFRKKKNQETRNNEQAIQLLEI